MIFSISTFGFCLSTFRQSKFVGYINTKHKYWTKKIDAELKNFLLTCYVRQFLHSFFSGFQINNQNFGKEIDMTEKRKQPAPSRVLTKHKPWTEGELQHLFASYEKFNSKWSSIQKHMPEHSQARLKNHFYGVLRGIVRFVLKYFKSVPKNSTEVSRKVHPNSLQFLYKGIKEFSFMEDIIPKAVADMGYQYNKHKLLNIVANNLQAFQKLSKLVVNLTAKSMREKSYEGDPSVQSNHSTSENRRVEPCCQPVHQDTFPWPENENNGVIVNAPECFGVGSYDWASPFHFDQSFWVIQPGHFIFSPHQVIQQSKLPRGYHY